MSVLYQILTKSRRNTVIFRFTFTMLYNTCAFNNANREPCCLINPFTLRVPLEGIFCYSHTFENNLGIKLKFTKYLRESCKYGTWSPFLHQILSRRYFCKQNIFKIARPIVAALSVNGLSKIVNSQDVYCKSRNYSGNNKIAIIALYPYALL